MKITPKKLETILRRYDDLKDYAYSFVREKRTAIGAGLVRFDDGGNVECETNTSCNCHPEYEWVFVATKQEFLDWLDKQQQ